MAASGDALAVGIVLWHLSGMEKSSEFSVSIRRLAKETGKSEKTARRGVRSLEEGGLVTVARPPGQRLRVTIVVGPD